MTARAGGGLRPRAATLRLQVGHPLSAAFTAATISLMVIIADSSASPATHDEMGAFPRAMFTSVMSSLIATSPLPSQSPLQLTAVGVGEGVAVAVGSSVGEGVTEWVGDGLCVGVDVCVSLGVGVSVCVGT